MSGKTCACGAPITRKAHSCVACGRASAARAMQRPLPADFAQVAPGKSIIQLRHMYTASQPTIVRWRVEAGIPTERSVPPSNRRDLPKGFALTAPSMTARDLRNHYSIGDAVLRRWCAQAGVQPRRHAAVVFRQVTPTRAADHREQSRAGMAAQFLQRFGPVFRCNENGRAEPKGTHWRRGSAILTDAELMERAERNGWTPDAWHRIAA